MDKKNKKLSVWHQKNYYKWWRIDKLIQHIKGLFIESYQRIRYGFSYYDAYEMYDWYGKVMSSMLRHFADVTNTFPIFYDEKDLSEGANTKFISQNHNISTFSPEEDGDIYFKKWQEILREMADCFDHATMDFYDSEFYNKNTDDFLATEKNDWTTKEGIKKVLDNINAPKSEAYEQAMASYHQHEKSFNEWQKEELHKGLVLLEKYFYDLWD